MAVVFISLNTCVIESVDREGRDIITTNNMTTVNLTEDDDLIVISDEEEPILIPKRRKYKKRKEKPICNITSVSAECTSELSYIKLEPVDSNLEPVASTSNNIDDTSLSLMDDPNIQSNEENINYLLEMERLKLEIFNYIEQLMNEQSLPENLNDSAHGCANVADAFSEISDSVLANISLNSSADSTQNITEITSSPESSAKPSQNSENNRDPFENTQDVPPHTELMDCTVEKLLTKPLNTFKLPSVSDSALRSAIFRTINDEIKSGESQNVELISIDTLEEMFAEPMENNEKSALVDVPVISESTDSSQESAKLPYFFKVAKQVENSPEVVKSFENPSETISVDSESSEDIPETTIKYVESSSSDASENVIPEDDEPVDTLSQDLEDCSESSDSDEISTESGEIELINFPQARKQSSESALVVIENFDSDNSELDENTGLDQLELLPGAASPPLSVELDKFLSPSSRSCKLRRTSSDPNISISVPCKEDISPGAARFKAKPSSLPEIGSKSPVQEIKDSDADLILDCDGKVLPVDIIRIFTNCKLNAEGVYELDGVPFRYISFTGTIVNKISSYDNVATFLIDDGSAVIKCRIEEFPGMKADREELQMLEEEIEKCPIVPITEEDYKIENVTIFLLEKTKRIFQECPVNDDILLGDELNIVGKVYDTSEERLVYAKYIWRENNIEFRHHRGCIPGQFMEPDVFSDFTN